MDKHTFTVLEFDKIITFLKYYVTSPQGHNLCELNSPLTNLQDIKTLLTEVTEMKEIKHYYQNGVPARKGIES